MRSINNVPVCVVGGAGFLGSHLVNALIEERNCRLLVVDNLVAGRREFIHPKAEFQHHDITGSEDFLRKLFVSRGIKYVLNYCAWPYIPTSFDRPVHVSDVNYMGAIKVINAAQEAGCEGVMQISSAEIYGDAIAGGTNGGNTTWIGEIKESYPVTPHSTYGSAKAAVDFYCQCAWKERKTPIIALRQFNCIGERDLLHPYVAIEVMCQLSRRCKGDKSGAAGIPIVHLGNNSTRDFMYAGDAVRIAVELLERGQWGEVYNLGSERSIKIYDLAVLIGKLMGFADVKVEPDEKRMRPWEIWHLAADNTKIKDAVYSLKGDATYRNLLWNPTSLEESLRRTINYLESVNWKVDWFKPTTE